MFFQSIDISHIFFHENIAIICNINTLVYEFQKTHIFTQSKKLTLQMEHYIINFVGNLENNCIQTCEYLFSAITQTEFSETQLFLQTSLCVQ